MDYLTPEVSSHLTLPLSSIAKWPVAKQKRGTGVQDLQPHCASRNRQVCLPASHRKCGIHARIAFFLYSSAISIEQTVNVAKFSWRQIFMGGFNHENLTPRIFNPRNLIFPLRKFLCIYTVHCTCTRAME